MTAATVYIALGSNLGARAQTLQAAVEVLGRTLRISALSHWLENPAVGGPAGQPPFLNGVLCARTALSARQVLQLCLQTESALGRDRGPAAVRWGARVLDLDVLFYDQAIIHQSPDLILPHPRAAQRRFVLQPLCEIAPGFIHPQLRQTMQTLLSRLD